MRTMLDPAAPAKIATNATPTSAAIDYCLEDSVGHLLRRAQQRHLALFQERIGEVSITPPQFATLLKLEEFGRVTQNRLGRSVAMDPATIQGVVQRLIARGLVDSSRDPMDRRTVVLSLTPAGRAVLRGTATQAHATNDALLDPLSVAERHQLCELLRRIAG
ncbi:MarR family winged helix-turn-helix transcriptional regulator [Roseomonas sp. NAR14]|uniref:MarR family winged helix-turn-helix transcriptional regulator n=1 Tax=Roseomonas acroporae TaxID=2937791 RepID=A0A9X2BW03_9PROT|nr:MarR family winged helix-turn-helix transcriptional regulator [Roseomonas acroporae]MCK8784574.1 MarR family winged helix-turn-helix transcriptional regulator [Roseomonas acroporae]